MDANKLVDRVKGILRYAHGIRHHGSKQAVFVVGIHGVRAAEGCIQIARPEAGFIDLAESNESCSNENLSHLPSITHIVP